MLHARPLIALSLALLGGCASAAQNVPPKTSEATTTTSTDAPYDPLEGRYPQIMWMCNVYEVPSGTEITSDGTVRASTSAKPNGVAVVGSAETTRILDSIRSLAGAKHLAAPAGFSPPRESARLGPGTRDMAGGSIGERSLTLKGELQGEGVRTAAEIAIKQGAFESSCHCGARDVPAGGALLFLCAGGDSGRPWTLLVVRPSILHSAADFPSQSASSFSTGPRGGM